MGPNLRRARRQTATECSVNTNAPFRTLETADTPSPVVALLGHSPFTTLVSNAGGGISRYGELAINRWRVDATSDNYGQWCYLQDVTSGKVWSAGHQPVCADTLLYRVSFGADRVTFDRRDGNFETRTDILVVAGAAAESRRVVVSNLSGVEAVVELTSYQEVVLAPILSDRGHRAFGNLFVQTEWLPELRSLLAMRRPRAALHQPEWCGHTIAVAAADGSISCETDRSIFVGRGRSSRNPVAIDKPGKLSGTVGAVLDPVLALRTRLVISPGGKSQVVFSTFFAKDRDDAVSLAKRFSDPESAGAPFESSSTDVPSADFGVSAKNEAAFQNLAGILLYGSSETHIARAASETKFSRADLLRTEITGEWPIFLAAVRTSDGLDHIDNLLTMHRYWHNKGVACDLVILCEGTDAKHLREKIILTLDVSGESITLDQSRGVFVLLADSLDSAQTTALKSVARIYMDCDSESLSDLASV